MSLRRTSRRDDNEQQIRKALEAVGALVKPLQHPCDLIVRFGGRVWLLEVDNPENKYRKRDQEQLDFLALWRVPIVQTPMQALRAIGAVA